MAQNIHPILLQGTSFAIAIDCFTVVETVVLIYSLSKPDWEGSDLSVNEGAWVHWNGMFLASVYTTEMIAKV